MNDKSKSVRIRDVMSFWRGVWRLQKLLDLCHSASKNVFMMSKMTSFFECLNFAFFTISLDELGYYREIAPFKVRSFDWRALSKEMKYNLVYRIQLQKSIFFFFERANSRTDQVNGIKKQLARGILHNTFLRAVHCVV